MNIQFSTFNERSGHNEGRGPRPGRKAGRWRGALRSLAIPLIVGALAGPSFADVVELEDGSFVEGTLAAEAKDFVTIVTAKRERKVLPRGKVRRVLKGATLLDVYREKLAAAPDRDAGAELALGLWCEACGRKGLAIRHFRRAAALDPTLAEARRKLGHAEWEGAWFETEEAMMRARGLEPFRGRWLVPAELEKAREGFSEHGGDWFTKEELSRIEAGKGVALPGGGEWRTFRTRHYRLGTRLRPEKSLRLADIAEQAFAAFREHFGFEPSGILEGRVFEDLSDFEDFTVGTGRTEPGALFSHGFFDAETRAVFFPYVDDDYTTIAILIHELCHQFEFLSGAAGAVPTWYFEGIACAFQHHLWRDGRLIPAQLASAKNFNLYYFQQIVRTGKAWALRDVLTGGPGAKVDPVFYHHAWGLVWFLMHAREGGYAEKFPAYEAFLHSRDSIGRDPVAAFEERFGALSKVEEDFRGYILAIPGLPWRGEGKPAGQK
jgi:hypothetical protein